MPYADPVVRKAFLASYYQKHKEKLKSRSAQWKRNHPDKLRAQIRRYRARHPDKYRQLKSWRWIKRGEQSEAANVTSWEKDWRSKPEIHCFWCRNAFEPRLCHVDHVIPLSKNGKHDLSNVVVSCRTCNQRKHNKHPTDWIIQLKREIGREVDVLWC